MKNCSNVTYHYVYSSWNTKNTLSEHYVTCHVRPHQPIINHQGLGLRGLVHKEAHPVIPDLHQYLFKGIYATAATDHYSSGIQGLTN